MRTRIDEFRERDIIQERNRQHNEWLKEQVQEGQLIGRGASAKVFEIKQDFGKEKDKRLVFKVFNREQAIIPPNPLDLEFSIQEKARNIILQHQDILPNIRIPEPIAIIEKTEAVEQEYFVMEKIQGEPLDLLLIKETLKKTPGGRTAFAEAMGKPYLLASHPDELQQLEAWEIIQQHYQPFLAIRKRNELQTAQRDIMGQHFRKQDPRLEILHEMASHFTAGKQQFLFPGKQELPITQSHVQQVQSVTTLFRKNGIAHRDLGPWNIMLTPDGDIAILDFGIAYLQADEKPIPEQQYNDEVFIIEQGGGHFDDLRFVDDRSAAAIFDILSTKEERSIFEELDTMSGTEQRAIQKKIEQLKTTDIQLTKELAFLLQDPTIQNVRQAIFKLRTETTAPKAGEFFSKTLLDSQRPNFLAGVVLMVKNNPQAAQTMIRGMLEFPEIPSKIKQQLKKLQAYLQNNQKLDE